MTLDRVALDRAARQKAREVLADAGIVDGPISVSKVADSVGFPLPIDDVEMPSRAFGALYKDGNSFRILVSRACFNEGFRRFTICHELGHLFLDGHLDELFETSNRHNSESGHFRGREKPWYETQADTFASELLVATDFARPLIRSAGHGLAAVHAIERKFETSLSCAAIRYADLAGDSVAVILSHDGTIEWACTSEQMREHWWGKRGLKGEWAPKTSVTAHLARAKASVAAGHERSAETWLNEWFEGAPAVSTEEEALGLGSYGRILTVLHCGNIPSPDQERVREDRERRGPKDWRDTMRTYSLDRYEDLSND